MFLPFQRHVGRIFSDLRVRLKSVRKFLNARIMIGYIDKNPT